MDHIGVIIPCYEVSAYLSNVLDGVLRHVPKERIYVVDDGSRDSTTQAAEHAVVRLIRHPVNRGKGEALKTGFRKAVQDGCDAVITLDGDAQHDPDSIPDFIKIMSETGCELVLGTRPIKSGVMPVDRIFSNRVSSMMVSALSGKWIPDSQCGFRMIRTAALKRVQLRTGHYETETELLVKMVRNGCKVGFCPIPVLQSPGSSHINRFRDTVRFCVLLFRLLVGGR